MGFRQPEQDEPAAGPRAAGDEAVAALYARYERAAHGLATTYLGNGDHADLVRAAFERTLATTRPVDGDGAFCARWFVTLRLLVAAEAAEAPGGLLHQPDALPDGLRDLPGPAVAPARQAAALRAFGMLPGRLQTVLWQTEVEARSSTDLAVLLGTTPTAVVALVTQARARLRAAVLDVRRNEPARPGCEPHRSRLAGYVGGDPGGRARTATAAHIAACPSCAGLARDLADLPGTVLQALGPLFERADPAPRDDERRRRGARAATGRPEGRGTGAATPPPGGLAALAGARRVVSGVVALVPARPGSVVLAGARRVVSGVVARVPARPGLAAATTVAVAVMLAIATVVTTGPPGGPGSADDLAGSSSVRAAPSTPTTRPPAGGRAVRPTPAPAPGSAPPGSAQPDPVELDSAPPAPVPVAPTPDAAAEPRSPAEPVATTLPEPAPAPPPAPPAPPAPVEPDQHVAAVPSVGSVAWSAADERVRVTLVNGTHRPTGFLVLTLAALGGALVSGQPSGCAMELGAVATGVCALAPLAPGTGAAVDVPIRVTGPGQSAQVTLCSAAMLRFDCDTGLLAPTTVALS